jgi:hypothetical protein
MGVLQFLLGIQLVGNQRTLLGAISCLVLMAAGVANMCTVSQPFSFVALVCSVYSQSCPVLSCSLYELAETRG